MKFLTTIFFVIFCSNVRAQNVERNAYTAPNQTERVIGAIKLIQNIRYGEIPAIVKDSISDRLLDLYLPEQAQGEKQLPLFVFIHGGGFAGGDKGLTDLCSKIASGGFIVASINYTLLLKYKKVKEASCSANMAAGLPVNGQFHPLLKEALLAASDDAISALKFLKANQKKYNIDFNNVAISGGSAGSMTALYLSYASNQKVTKIKAVVDLWGGLENTNVIKKGAPPVLIYHGDLDKLINVDYAYALDKRMKEVGSNNSDLQILKGRGHAEYKYIAQNKTAEIIGFLKANLK